MCWISKIEPLIKTAEENIPIFKICTETEDEDNVCSYFQVFTYRLNKVYEHNGSTLQYYKTRCNEYQIKIGFHSYSADIKDVYIGRSPMGYHLLWINLLSSGNSRAMYATESFCGKRRNVIRVNGYIPKGASYVINNNGECVSDKIVLTEIQTIK